MPSTKSRVLGEGYETDPIREYAESWNNVVNAVVRESGYDYYEETAKALKDAEVQNSLRNFFIEGSYDTDPNNMRPAEIDKHRRDMAQLFENDMTAMQEACNVANFNALVGMALPMHKNIMMNMVWDKGGIPKKVADSPKIVRTMEIRKLVKPDGTEIDMFTQQNLMTKAMMDINPWVEVPLAVGESGQTEIVSAYLNGGEGTDHLDINTFISGVLVKDVYYEEGDILPGEDGYVPATGGVKATSSTKGKHDTYYHVRLKFTPGYGEVKRQLMRPVKFDVKMNKGSDEAPDVQIVTIDDVISANLIGDRFMVNAMKGAVAGIKISAKLDASMRTIEPCHVAWSEITDIVEIGTDEGISTSVSPEEVKDVSVLYNINQLTKNMSLMKTALANRKDDMIKMNMDESYERLGANQKFYGTFDFAPREGYMLDSLEWRQRTFWDYFDHYVTNMLRVLNDPQLSVAVYGEPDIIRRLTPKTYTYSAPDAIGPVELDFTKTVCTSDKRVYNFVGSDKLRNDYELIITLCPRNTNRIIYCIYDYQFYISNEIRSNNNPALPQILAFERWLFDEYQPVQGRMKIANPSGFRPTDVTDTDSGIFY